MRPMEKLRPKVVGRATGRVLEVGVGTGLNLAHYDWDQVQSWVGIDPDPHMRVRAEPRAEAAGQSGQILAAGAEALPFDDGAFDELVITFALCTIPDVDAAVAEMRRVLVPGGRLHFVEHTRSDHAPMALFQRAIHPVWTRLSGGCHLHRDAVALLQEGGFEVEELYDHGRTPLNLSPVHRGVARRA